MHMNYMCNALQNVCKEEKFVQKWYKTKDFFSLFTIICPKLTWMLLKQFHLGNNLPRHIRENKDFPWQKPQQLLSTKVNFEGCVWHFHFQNRPFLAEIAVQHTLRNNITDLQYNIRNEKNSKEAIGTKCCKCNQFLQSLFSTTKISMYIIVSITRFYTYFKNFIPKYFKLDDLLRKNHF